MENYKLMPLSDFERQEAERNHNLIYDFLHKRGYSPETFYDVAVFGYLKGIQVYYRREDLRGKYALAFICKQYMRAESENYFKAENAQKRKPVEKILSLDSDYDGAENLYKVSAAKSAETEVLESEQLAELFNGLSKLQRKIIEMRLWGYGNKEACQVLEIKPSAYYKELRRIKRTLEKINSQGEAQFQQRKIYGTTHNQTSFVKYPCRGCIYFNACGENTRTEPCKGRRTRRDKKRLDSCHNGK